MGLGNWISGEQSIRGLGVENMAQLLLIKEPWEVLAQKAHHNANELARLCGVSTRQLQRHFRRNFHCSPQAWLNQRRLLLAQLLLLKGDSVKKVALDLGFKQTSHFCRQFKSHNNMTPSEFTFSQAMSLMANNGRLQITTVVDR